MHETHLIEPVIKGIMQHAREEGAHAVKKLILKVGLLTGVKDATTRKSPIATTNGGNQYPPKTGGPNAGIHRAAPQGKRKNRRNSGSHMAHPRLKSNRA